ncbi:MAG: metal ABC transporter substrate-binding protein [Beijerinckiaceae bacterium]
MMDRRAVLLASGLLALPAPLFAQTAKLPVVASFSIVGDIAREIGGERIALETLVKAGVDAHVFQPSPSDARLVAGAKIVVTNGLKFETWMNRLMQSSASKATLVEAAKGVKTRAEAKGTGHSHGHSHGHAQGAVDPHAWQDVANVKLYAANLRDALIGADPDGKAVYDANAARYLGELDVLEKDIRDGIAKIPAERRKVITGHDAFAYFGAAYGLKFLAPRGVSTNAEASAKDVAQLITQIKREKVPAVFLENISDQRLIQQIARETGAKVGGQLFSDALSAADGPAPTYIRMMRHNIQTIVAALAPTS